MAKDKDSKNVKDKKDSKVAKESKEQEKAPVKNRNQNQNQNTTSIIRLSGRDISGTLKIEDAIRKIKGIGFSMASALTYAIDKNLKIDPSETLESLNEEQIAKLEDVIKEPEKYGIPAFMLNRRKDMETGKDVHVVGNDLIFANRQDINRGTVLRTLVGYRHQYGHKVRGQHTRSTGRKGVTVGVTRKANKPGVAAKPAAKK